MSTITRLPNRPLQEQDIVALRGEDRLQIVPYGGIPEAEKVRVYAVKIATGDTAHALGFDDSQARWQHLASVDAADLAAADSQLDPVLDDWVQENYGGQFKVHKNV